jgi:hypothetical protein
MFKVAVVETSNMGIEFRSKMTSSEISFEHCTLSKGSLIKAY